MESKSIFASKTFWVNVITGLVLFVALPELQNVISMDVAKYLLLAQAGLNIVLRLLTTQPASVMGSK